MNKFKFTFKVKELELQVEGSREDMGAITNSIGQQLKGMIQTTDVIDELPATSGLAVTDAGEITEAKTPARKNRTTSAGSKKEKGKVKGLDLNHDPAKYGSPVQSWKTFEKAIWLLYVMQHEASVTELSASEIAETFNKHFKQQGTIRPNNISRDFGNQKAGSKATVGENANGVPSKWYLLEEGTRLAQKLIADLKSGTV